MVNEVLNFVIDPWKDGLDECPPNCLLMDRQPSSFVDIEHLLAGQFGVFSASSDRLPWLNGQTLQHGGRLSSAFVLHAIVLSGAECIVKLIERTIDLHNDLG